MLNATLFREHIIKTPKSRKALIIGASGATGKELVPVLPEDTKYTEIVIFVCRASGIIHPRLTEVRTDFDRRMCSAPAITLIEPDKIFSS